MTNDPHVFMFNTFEEAQEFIAKGDDYGNRNLHPKQAAITWGDHWVRFYDLHARIIIFSEVTPLSYWDDKIDHSVGEDREEWIYERNHIVDAADRGYVWGWCSSKDYHEPGSTHRFNVWPISPELYEAAKAVEWDIDRLPDEHRPALDRAWQEYREHALAVLDSGDRP